MPLILKRLYSVVPGTLTVIVTSSAILEEHFLTLCQSIEARCQPIEIWLLHSCTKNHIWKRPSI